MSNQVTVDQIILQKLHNEIGTLKGRVLQVETFNEILIQQNEQLRAELDEYKPDEQGEGEDTQEEGE